MTTYRLLNNVNKYHEAFADFRAMRKQFDGVKVWFSQKNETLLDKLKGTSKNSNFFVRARKHRPESRSLCGVNEDSRTELTPLSRKKCIFRDALKAKWQPVSVTFESDGKNNQLPDISIWNSSCLILSERAKATLEPLLQGRGECLALQNSYTLFNCLESVGGDAISPAGSSFEMATEDSLHIPKTLKLLDEKLVGKVLFKPSFAHNSFLICQDDFKNTVQKHELGGVVFEPDLAHIFL